MGSCDLEELERMARNFSTESELSCEDIQVTAKRWTKLFRYSYSDAIDAIDRHRENISRKHVTNELWDIVKQEQEERGYDREAYEHGLEIQARRRITSISSQAPAPYQAGDPKARYLVKLTELLTPEIITGIAGLSSHPEVVEGLGNEDSQSRDARFCFINGIDRQAFLASSQWEEFASKSTIIRVPQLAAKEFSSYSAYPTFGLYTTLPQHRPSVLPTSTPFLPAQDQYPVWYFFYGTLGNSSFLQDLLSLGSEPELVPAVVKGGKLKMWKGKYKALVDGLDGESVEGVAYEVVKKEYEDLLRSYETDAYEVVRCGIKVGRDEQVVVGCTFRFVG